MKTTSLSPPTLTCHEVQLRLQEEAASQPQHDQATINHILACPMCRQAQRDLRRLSRWIGEAGHATSANATSLSPQSIAQRAIAISQQRRQRRRWQWSTLTATATALLLCLSWPTTTQPTAPPSAQTPSPRIAQSNKHIKMIWPSDHVFVISKSTKKRTTTKRTQPKSS